MSRSVILRSSVIAILVSVLAPSQLWPSPQTVRGTVKDRAGAVIARAQVMFQANGQELRRVTQPDGSFSFGGVDSDGGTISVSASGFARDNLLAGGRERRDAYAGSGPSSTESRRNCSLAPLFCQLVSTIGGTA